MASLHRPMFGARLFADQRLVDMRNDATAGDRGFDQAVQFLVSSDGELEMPGRDSLHFEILGRVSRQLENLSRQVFQDSGTVNGGGGTNSAVGRGPRLEMSVDSSDGKLKTGLGGSGHGLRLHLPRIFTSFSSGHF